MKRGKQTSRAFYKHSQTNDIFCIEMRWDGVILRSAGPLPEDKLKDADDYELSDRQNLWVQSISDKLILRDE